MWALGGEEPTKLLPSEETRKVYWRRIKDFWYDYKRNKIGLVGITILIIFIATAVLAPKLTPYDPMETKFLADGLAAPQWATIFPQYRDLPPTTEIPANWEGSNLPPSVNVEFNESSKDLLVEYNGSGTEKADIHLDANFLYPYRPPKSFSYQFNWKAERVKGMKYSLELTFVNPEGFKYSFWDSRYGYGVKPPGTSEIPLSNEEKNWTFVKANSWYTVALQSRLQLPLGYASIIFREKGEYYWLLHIVFEPTSENATCEINLKDTKIKIPGLVHGILGADEMGGDIFTQLVYGTQISLVIGVTAAVFIMLIGTAVGVISGYVGGIVDELLMRITDIVLCLPLLPLLIIMVALFKSTMTTVFGSSLPLIVILIAGLWWTTLARVIRSRVLSLREMAFVESAKAVGAGKFYIIFKHMVPNVLPIAFAAMILNVPSAIVMEAVLSFIGLGDPIVPTWGKMLEHAFRSGAFDKMAWWWILPPGLALMTLAMSFAFIGHAVDEIVNPRLRRRR